MATLSLGFGDRYACRRLAMTEQGLNLGIGDVMSLAAVLDEGAKSGLDLGGE